LFLVFFASAAPSIRRLGYPMSFLSGCNMLDKDKRKTTVVYSCILIDRCLPFQHHRGGNGCWTGVSHCQLFRLPIRKALWEPISPKYNEWEHFLRFETR